MGKPKYLSLQSVHDEYIELEVDTLRTMILRGELTGALKIGRRWFIPRDALEKFFQEHEYKPRRRAPLRLSRG